ncbi:MAG: serine--tRNA ligase, partial [Oscillospiraceae bacterium]
MLDIKFVRENPNIVKENIKKKYQDSKLELVDKVIDLDIQIRELKKTGDELRSTRNKISEEIGSLMREKKVAEGNLKKEEVTSINNQLVSIEKQETELSTILKEHMMHIPNIIDA